MTLTITLELTAEQEDRLRADAARAGSDLADYVTRLADRSIAATAKGIRSRSVAPQTGAQIAEELISAGIIGSGYGDPSIDSPDLARDSHNKVWRTQAQP